jgi:hypothetical protein
MRLLFALALLGSAPAAAQAPRYASVDTLIADLYAVISGPAGEQRDWGRFQQLFVPGARLIPTSVARDGRPGAARVLSPDEYATTVGPRLEQMGFFEREIGRVQERYGNILHMMSAYDSKRTLADPQPFARGINSIQCFWDGTRWWVVTIFWDSERPDTPIPPRFFARP